VCERGRERERERERGRERERERGGRENSDSSQLREKKNTESRYNLIVLLLITKDVK
jgi:hypothetical protein